MKENEGKEEITTPPPPPLPLTAARTAGLVQLKANITQTVQFVFVNVSVGNCKYAGDIC